MILLATLGFRTRHRDMTHHNSDRARTDVTQLLVLWTDGNQQAMEQLLPLVYDELRKLARRYLQRERPGHTLQSTALVHEAYMRLVNQRDVSWQGRAHLFGIAAQMMRRILVDHALAGRRMAGT